MVINVGGEQPQNKATPAMSRIPQGSSTRPKKVTKEFPEDNKGRLIELFRRLENSSDQDVAVPTAAQMEK
jgi:hypothetical protein